MNVFKPFCGLANITNIFVTLGLGAMPLVTGVLLYWKDSDFAVYIIGLGLVLVTMVPVSEVILKQRKLHAQIRGFLPD